MTSPAPAVPFDTLIARLIAAFPGVPRSHVETIVFDEHDLLYGGPVGDLVPGAVEGAVTERLAREGEAMSSSDAAG